VSCAVGSQGVQSRCSGLAQDSCMEKVAALMYACADVPGWFNLRGLLE
jgi:hypothetical protein